MIISLFLVLSILLLLVGIYGISKSGQALMRVLDRLFDLDAESVLRPGPFGSILALGTACILFLISFGLWSGMRWAINSAAIFGGLSSFLGLMRMLEADLLGAAYLLIGLTIMLYLMFSRSVHDFIGIK